jgi:hypothetical protein
MHEKILQITLTGEPVQPTRLSYRVYDKEVAGGIVKPTGLGDGRL